MGGGRLAWAYRLFERLAAGLADVIIAVSLREASDGKAVLGKRGAAKIRVISNGVNSEEYRPDGVVAERDADPLVVVVGRFHVAKGQDLAARALSHVRDSRTRLRFVGDGSTRQAVEHLVSSLGLTARVEMIGTADPRPHLRAADVVLVPSRWEALSLLVLEAMSCGCAIVATEIAGEELLSGAGVVVRGADPVLSMAKALDDLLPDDRRRRALGEAARVRAITEYSLERMNERYLGAWLP